MRLRLPFRSMVNLRLASTGAWGKAHDMPTALSPLQPAPLCSRLYRNSGPRPANSTAMAKGSSPCAAWLVHLLFTLIGIALTTLLDIDSACGESTSDCCLHQQLYYLGGPEYAMHDGSY